MVVALGLFACGGSQQSAETSKSMTPSQAAAPLPSTLTVEEAERIVREARGAFAHPDSQNPLRQPKSLDDVLAILRTDQIDLFAAGVAFAEKDASPRAKALQAQIEIAWGENQRIVAQLLDGLSGELREEILELRESEAAGKLSPADAERVAEGQLPQPDRVGISQRREAVEEQNLGCGHSQILVAAARSHAPRARRAGARARG